METSFNEIVFKPLSRWCVDTIPNNRSKCPLNSPVQSSVTLTQVCQWDNALQWWWPRKYCSEYQLWMNDWYLSKLCNRKLSFLYSAFCLRAADSLVTTNLPQPPKYLFRCVSISIPYLCWLVGWLVKSSVTDNIRLPLCWCLLMLVDHGMIYPLPFCPRPLLSSSVSDRKYGPLLF